jgi:hypothetical protein
LRALSAGHDAHMTTIVETRIRFTPRTRNR